MNNNSSVSQKSQIKDYTVVKVMAALVLLVLSLVLLRAAGASLVTLGGMETVYPLVTAGQYVFAVLSAASLAILLFSRNKVLRAVCRYTLAFFLLWLVSCLIMHARLADQMILIYFLHAVSYCLYIVYMLYKAEFFAVSLLNCVAGWTFYRFFPGIAADGRVIGYGLLLAVVCALTALFARAMYRTHGMLTVGRKKIRLCPQSFHPTFLYVCSGLWLVCLVASLFIGALFAYYCMFAAIAVELIAAVYYTFKMK